MSETVEKRAVYEDLFSIPENMTGEIVDGELVLTPKPSPSHAIAAGVFITSILSPYQLGRGGPGGWVIVPEVEVMLGEHLLVPDISGWRKERFPDKFETNWISVTPDWVCEIMSPGTARLDRVRKMPLYAKYGIPHMWIINPMEKTIEAYRLESGRWTLLCAFADNDRVQAEPFMEIEIELGDLWIE